MMRIFWGKISNYSERVPNGAVAQEAEAHNQFHRARATGNGSRRRSATTAIAGAAALAGAGLVLLLALLIGCAPSSSSGSNGNGNGPPRPMVMTIGEAVDCTTDADTVCTFDVGDTFEGGKSDAVDDGDWIKVALAADTTYRVSVDPADDSTMATVAIYSAPATATSPTIGNDMLWTATAAQNYYIEVVLDAVGEYTLTIAAAPEGSEACNSMDAEADCDGDSVANADDEFDRDAARSCTITADNGTLDCDNDGYANSMDNCPAVANPGQEEDAAMIDSMTVTDTDDVGDACDVDLDNDGLIEIANLDALNNIRYNLAGTSYDTDEADGTGAFGSTGGAPTTEQPACDDGDSATTRLLCGYELVRSLNFATDADYAAGALNMDWRPNMADPASATNVGWQPLAHDTDSGTTNFQGTSFNAILEGNGNTITNLYINRASEDYVGLIGNANNRGTIRNLGLVDVFVVGNINAGGITGVIDGTISGSYSSGRVTGATVIGGLAGRNGGTIVASYSSAGVTNSASAAGGLVGLNFGGRISVSWSIGSVSGTSRSGGLIGWNFGGVTSANYSSSSVMGTNDVGGLVGYNSDDGRIFASYSSGRVMGTDNVGGLVGNNSGGRIATSYWDTTTSMRTFGLGNDDIDNDNHLDNTPEDDDDGDGMLDTDEDDDNDGRRDAGTEANRLGDANLGLTTAQMRVGSGTFPDFGAVDSIISTLLARQHGDFSAAWDYSTDCYPRLKRWVGAGGDDIIGTNDDTFSSELLPEQGTSAAMDGACTTA